LTFRESWKKTTLAITIYALRVTDAKSEVEGDVTSWLRKNVSLLSTVLFSQFSILRIECGNLVP
jgi:hypothetical protein